MQQLCGIMLHVLRYCKLAYRILRRKGTRQAVLCDRSIRLSRELRLYELYCISGRLMNWIWLKVQAVANHADAMYCMQWDCSKSDLYSCTKRPFPPPCCTFETCFQVSRRGIVILLKCLYSRMRAALIHKRS